MALKVGDLFATLSLKDQNFQKGLANNNKVVGRFTQLATGAIAGLAATITAALGGALAAAAKGVMDLDSAMKKLQAQTGLTDEEMKGLEQSVKNIYKAGVGESFEAIASAMAHARNMTGLAGTELESFTKNALNFAEVFDQDVNWAIEAATALMKDFGVSGDEAFNLLVQGMQKGLNKNDELLETIREYSPQFRALGFTAEQMFDTLIAGAEAGGWSLDKVADAVKEFNIRAKDGSKTTIEAFQALGMNAEEMMRTFAEGGPKAQEAFGQVVNAIAKVEDPVERNTIAVALFGTQYEDLEMKALQALGNVRSQTDRTKQSMDEINKMKFEGLGATIKRIGRIFQVEMMPIIEKNVLPVLKELAQWLEKNLPKAIQGLGAAMDIWREMSNAVNEFMAPVREALGNSFKELGGSFIEVWESIKSIVTSLKPAFIALGAVIGTLMAVSFSTFNGIIRALGPLLEALGDLLEITAHVIGGVIKLLTGDFSGAVEEFKGVGEAMGEFFMDLFDGLLGFFEGFSESILSILAALGLDIPTTWEGIGAAMSEKIEAISSWFTEKWNGLVSWFQELWQGVKDFFGEIWSSIWSVIGPPIEATIKYLTDNWSEIKEFFSILWEAVKALFQVAWKLIKQAIETIVGPIIKWLKDKWNENKATLQAVWNAVVSIAKTAWNWLSNVIKQYVGPVVQWLIDKFNEGKSNTSSIFDKIVSIAKSKWNWVKKNIIDPVKSAKDKVIGYLNDIKSFFNNLRLKIPKPKLPHIKVSKGVTNIAGVEVPYPKFSISWYKRGGLFAGPSIIGVGEAGPEAVVPLSGHRMRPFAMEIAKILERLERSSQTRREPTVIHVPVHLDGRQIARVTAPYMNEELGFMAYRRQFAPGRLGR